jgi:hypothetical protein
MEKYSLFPTNVAGKIGKKCCLQKTETRSMSVSLHKYQFKED